MRADGRTAMVHLRVSRLLGLQGHEHRQVQSMLAEKGPVPLFTTTFHCHKGLAAVVTKGLKQKHDGHCLTSTIPA